MTEEQRDLVDDGYTLVSAGDSQYVKDYPVSQTEDIYVLETKDKKQREDMEAAFSLPMLIVFGIESGGDAAAAIEDQLTAQIPETLLDSLRDENGRIDLFALFAMMSEDQLQALAQQMTVKCPRCRICLWNRWEFSTFRVNIRLSVWILTRCRATIFL